MTIDVDDIPQMLRAARAHNEFRTTLENKLSQLRTQLVPSSRAGEYDRGRYDVLREIAIYMNQATQRLGLVQ
jgi:flagellar hook-basal body complex protein FliE